ncbi:sigma-70 family RNA polymerase sigma factor [Bordetella sp. 2513F-2]
MPRTAQPRKDWLAHYAELITRWRRGGHGSENGEDAMHDTVLGMLEGGVGAIHDPRAYMARGTSNRLVSRHRHVNALEITSLDSMDEVEHPATAPADDGIRFQQLADALAVALAELPLKCRQVYIMCRLEGWTHTEIAHQMGLSRSMVEKYMTRSVRHINERLQHHAPN